MPSTLEAIAHGVLSAQANPSPTLVDPLVAAILAAFGVSPGSDDWTATSKSSSRVVQLKSASVSTSDLTILLAGSDSVAPIAGAMQGGLHPPVTGELYCALSPDGEANSDPWAATTISDDAAGIWPTGQRGTGWLTCCPDSQITIGIDTVEGLTASERVLLMLEREDGRYIPLDIGAIVAALDDTAAEGDKRIYGVMFTSPFSTLPPIGTDFVSLANGNVNGAWGRNNASTPTNSTSGCFVYDPKSPTSLVSLFNPMAMAPTYDTLAFEDEDIRQSHLRIPLMRTSNGRIIGYWRQIGYGRKEEMLAEYSVEGVIESHAISAMKGGLYEAVWVDDFVE